MLSLLQRPWHSKHKIVNRLRRLCRGPLELGCAAADRSFMVSLCCVEKVMERTSLYIQAEEEEENRGYLHSQTCTVQY